MMKKLLSFALTAMLVFACFTACAPQENTPQASATPAGTDEATGLTITGWNSLNGLSAAYQSGTTAEGKITELNETGSVKCTAYPNEDMAVCFSMLANNEVQTVVCDLAVAEDFCAKNPDKYQVAWVQEDTPEEFAIAVPKGTSTDLLAAINEAMDELKAEGFLDKLHDKWFGSGAEVTMPTEKTVECKAKLVNDGYFTVGSEIGYPPYEAYDENDVPVGFDIDLTKAIAIKLGLEVNYVDRAFDTIFSAMGQDYDVVCAAVTIDDVRKESMDFSDPYIKNYLAVVVAK